MLHHHEVSPRSYRPSRTPRRRIVALVVGVGGMLTILIAGLALSVAAVFDQKPDDHRASPVPGLIGKSLDLTDDGHQLAAASNGVDPEQRTIGGSSSLLDAPGAALVLPASTAMGPDEVATGYPQSAEGAVAQLAAIDLAALDRHAAPAERVLRTWSQGRVAADLGSYTVANLVDRARVADRTSRNKVTAMPIMARTAGSDGPSRHTVCVLLAVRIGGSVSLQSRIEPDEYFAHCESMVWDDGHWAISPGNGFVDKPAGHLHAGSDRWHGYRMLEWAATPDQR